MTPHVIADHGTKKDQGAMADASSYRPVLTQALDLALQYLEGRDEMPVGAPADLAELRRRLALPLAERGNPASLVIDELAKNVTPGLHGSAGARFFGWVMGGTLPAALAADWLTAAWDQNAALYACSPASAVVEEVAGEWLKELLNIPRGASFAFVTGSQMAHATCLAAARHSLLAKRNWDVERQGLCGAPRIRLLGSAERHGSIDRAVRLLGFGSDTLTQLPGDESGRLSPGALAGALDSVGGDPVVVILKAADLSIGAFDPYLELIPVAHSKGAWVHVDGAFGLWAAASEKYRHFVKGLELADSWTTDGHKWLNVPYDSGYAFIADRAAHRAANSHRAQYLTHDDDARDQMDWNPEWSRRARGFATYAAIRELGRQGIADLIDRTCRHAHNLAVRISELPGAELLWKPTLNQGLVRFLDPSPAASERDHDRRTDQVIADIVKSGEAFFTGATWRGKRCMRISVVSWLTSEADVDRSVAAVRKALSGAP